MRRRDRHRVLLAQWKDVPCTDCQDRFPSSAMEFDHVRGMKVGNLSDLVHLPIELLREEAAKCEIVCANCHRNRTTARAHDAHEADADDAELSLLLD